MLAVRKREIETLLKTLRAEKKRIQHPRQVWVMDYALLLYQAGHKPKVLLFI